jgi:hypothetical protein
MTRTDFIVQAAIAAGIVAVIAVASVFLIEAHDPFFVARLGL